MDDFYDDPRVARAESPGSDLYVGAGEFAGEIGGLTVAGVGGRAPRESEHRGKGFRTALRERQLAAIDARRGANVANGGNGGRDDANERPRVNAYQAVDDTPCVGAQTFSATKGLVGLEDAEAGFDAAAGGDVAAWDVDDDAPRGMGEEDDNGDDEEKEEEKEEEDGGEDDEEEDDEDDDDDDDEDDDDSEDED